MTSILELTKVLTPQKPVLDTNAPVPEAKSEKKKPIKFVKHTMYMVYNKIRFKELKQTSPELTFIEISKQVSNDYK